MKSCNKFTSIQLPVWIGLVPRRFARWSAMIDRKCRLDFRIQDSRSGAGLLRVTVWVSFSLTDDNRSVRIGWIEQGALWHNFPAIWWNAIPHIRMTWVCSSRRVINMGMCFPSLPLHWFAVIKRMRRSWMVW